MSAPEPRILPSPDVCLSAAILACALRRDDPASTAALEAARMRAPVTGTWQELVLFVSEGVSAHSLDDRELNAAACIAVTVARNDAGTIAAIREAGALAPEDDGWPCMASWLLDGLAGRLPAASVVA